MSAKINTQNRPKSDVAIMFKLLENKNLLEQEVDSKALCAVFQQKHDQTSSFLTIPTVSLMSHRLSLSQNDGEDKQGKKATEREVEKRRVVQWLPLCLYSRQDMRRGGRSRGSNQKSSVERRERERESENERQQAG